MEAWRWGRGTSWETSSCQKGWAARSKGELDHLKQTWRTLFLQSRLETPGKLRQHKQKSSRHVSGLLTL